MLVLCGTPVPENEYDLVAVAKVGLQLGSTHPNFDDSGRDPSHKIPARVLTRAD